MSEVGIHYCDSCSGECRSLDAAQQELERQTKRAQDERATRQRWIDIAGEWQEKYGAAQRKIEALANALRDAMAHRFGWRKIAHAALAALEVKHDQ